MNNMYNHYSQDIELTAEKSHPVLRGPLTADNIQRWLTELMAEELGFDIDSMDAKMDFDQYGIDSVVAIGIGQTINSVLGVKITPLDLMQNPNLEKLSNFLANEVTNQEREFLEI
ncbi:MAG: non-ribosomal peptide synthetase [Rivularia sp. ALOHA_DT_140]|nr:non-ribosomal peptide synthetase [Rivularia sp. ALOHA_DT_140]